MISEVLKLNEIAKKKIITHEEEALSQTLFKIQNNWYGMSIDQSKWTLVTMLGHVLKATS